MCPVYSPCINPRLANVKESATLAINSEAKAMRAAGKEIAHFGFGESPFSIHPKLLCALAANAHHNSYLPGLGLPQLRARIASYYRARSGVDFSVERIAIGPGSKELLFHLLYVLDGPLVLPAPSWVSYTPQAILHDKPVYTVRAYREDNYNIRPEALAAVLADIRAPQTILVLNSPNNPTGQTYNREALASIAAVCREHNTIVIADEIYAQTDFTAPLSPGLAEFYPQRVIVTAGLSKAYSAGGWRCGFAAAAHADLLPVFEALAVVISETYSCVCAPLQYAACVAYSGDLDVEQQIRTCAHTHAAVVFETTRRLRAAGVYCANGMGGFYLFPNFDDFRQQLQHRGITSSTELATALLQECAVATLPATDFGLPPQELALRLAPMDYDGDALLNAIANTNNDPHSLISTHAEELIPRIVSGCERLTRWLGQL